MVVFGTIYIYINNIQKYHPKYHVQIRPLTGDVPFGTMVFARFISMSLIRWEIIDKPRMRYIWEDSASMQGMWGVCACGAGQIAPLVRPLPIKKAAPKHRLGESL